MPEGISDNRVEPFKITLTKEEIEAKIAALEAALLDFKKDDFFKQDAADLQMIIDNLKQRAEGM